MGAASSVREIVKERPIYQRERSIGLSAGAYLWSKVIVLSVVVTCQAILLTQRILALRVRLSSPASSERGGIGVCDHGVDGVNQTTRPIPAHSRVPRDR